MSKTKLCISCMTRVAADAEYCPYCKYDGTQENDSYALPIGARIGERYVLGRTLDCDGEKITYVGFDLVAKTRVIIKEFMPLHGALRNSETGEVTPKSGAEIHYKTGLLDFTEMYTALKGLSSVDGLVKTIDVVQKSNTAYAVQEFFSGVSFKNFVKRNEGKLTVERCVELLSPVIDALAVMHEKSMLHCAISPENIKLNKDGDVKIGGFATPSTRTAGTEYPPHMHDGFTAPEQYANNTFLTPAADVYALAATIYYAVTGKIPASAEQRKKFDSLQSLSELVPETPDYVSRAINSAMVLNPKQRTQTILEFKGNLQNSIEYASPEVTGQEAEQTAEDYAEDSESTELLEAEAEQLLEPTVPRILKTLTIIAAGSCAVMAIVYFAWQFILFQNNNKVIDTGPVEEQEYLVSNFLGVSIDELVLDGNFAYEISYTYSDDYPAGTIAEQSPLPNSPYERGNKVALRISQGQNRIKMPDFLNVTPNNVQAMIDNLGITLDFSVEYETSTTGIPGAIFKQSVLAGSEINPEEVAVILYVAVAPTT